MRIGNKIFPYPTLNNNNHLSGYNDTSDFEVKFDTSQEGELIIENNQVVLRNICFLLENEKLKELYNDNKLKCALIVECSSSLFRKMLHINEKPVEITFPIYDLNSIVNISAYMYAT